MKYFLHPIFLLISLGLTGCGIGGFWMNGNPNLSPTYPYGAHWIKEGMTRESRRLDLAACGSIGKEDVRFQQEQLEMARLPNEPNDISAYLRLRAQLGVCMSSRGYTPVGDLKYLGGCDDRCMYP